MVSVVRVAIATQVLVLLLHFLPLRWMDNRLKPYYKEFIELNAQVCPSLEIPRKFIVEWGDLGKDGYVGLCETGPGIARITIHNKVKDEEVYGIIMHEFGHCLLHLNHTEDKDHFMYAYENFLPKPIVQAQLIEAMRENCNK